MFSKCLTVLGCLAVLAFAIPALAQAEQDTVDVREKTVKGLSLGMTYDEAVNTLKEQDITLNPNFKGGMVKTDIGRLFKLDLDGQTFKYYLIQEARYKDQNGKDEVIRLGFSVPAPGKTQQLTEIFYQGNLGNDVKVEDMVDMMTERYGAPPKTGIRGGRATLQYGTFKSDRNFPLWTQKSFKRNNNGMEIRIYTAESTAMSPGFLIHMGNADMYFERQHEVYLIQKEMQAQAEAVRPKDKSVSSF